MEKAEGTKIDQILRAVLTMQGQITIMKNQMSTQGEKIEKIQAEMATKKDIKELQKAPCFRIKQN